MSDLYKGLIEREEGLGYDNIEIVFDNNVALYVVFVSRTNIGDTINVGMIHNRHRTNVLYNIKTKTCYVQHGEVDMYNISSINITNRILKGE